MQRDVFPTTVRVQCPGHVEIFKAVVRLGQDLRVFIDCPTCARRYRPDGNFGRVTWSAGDRDLKFLDLVPEFLS